MSLATVDSGIYFRYHVRQSNIQLTSFSYCRSSVKTRLRCSSIELCLYFTDVATSCKPTTIIQTVAVLLKP